MVSFGIAGGRGEAELVLMQSLRAAEAAQPAGTQEEKHLSHNQDPGR